MYSFLKMLAIEFLANKCLNFLLKVFSGKTGEVTQKHHEIINKYVKMTEDIYDRIKELLDRDYFQEDSVIDYIQKNFDLPEFDYFKYQNLMSFGKRDFCYELICKELIKNEEDFTEQAIKLGIEMAVNAFYSK